MSQYGQPNNPYQTGPQQQRPYRQRIVTRKPPPWWKNPLWIVTIIFGSISLCVLCCCGAGIAFWWVDQTQTTKEVADLLRDNEALKKEIGELEGFTLNWSKTQANEDMDTCVYDAKGSKRDAQVTVNWVVDDNFNVEIVWATVRTTEGVERQLFGDPQPAGFGFGGGRFE